MIRVLQYIGSLKIGGSQTFIMEIYRKIDRTVIQFDFIVFSGEEGDFCDEIKALGGRIFVSPRYFGKNHVGFTKWWDIFLKNHLEYKVVHFHVRSIAAICIPIAKRRGIVTIAHSHSTSNGDGIQAIVKDIMQFPIRFQADYLFACSQEAGRWLYGKNVVKRKNYYVVHNVVDTKRFSFNPERREKLRNKLKIADSSVIGHVGRFSAPKNHKYLLKVFCEIRRINKNVKLILVGDGELKKEIRDLCKKLNMIDEVLLVGNVSNTEEYYWAMDVFVFPSLWEGMPVSVVEAQASGLICIISDKVTRDVKISKRIKYLPLEIGEKEWAKEVCELLQQRKREACHVKNSVLKCYDSYNASKWFENFYKNII